MKRNIILFTVLAAFVLSAFSCSGSKLSLYNWAYYTPESVIEKFEKEYKVKVICDEFESNEEMYTKLKTGGTGFDIVFPSQDYVSIMIKQGMFEKIDKSLIPNLKNIDPIVIAKADYDPNLEYSVPYYWGAAGILVNTAKVPNFEKSWSIFSRSDLRGRMTMLDDMREVMGDALRYLGYSVNSKNPGEIAAARDVINYQWKPNLTKFDAVAFGKGFANGEFWVCQGYAEEVFLEIDDEQLMNDTFFFIPPEGGPSYLDSMCILKGSKNKELAHKFIDFIHRPDIYAEFCDDFGFPSTVNIPARQLTEGPSWYKLEDITGNSRLELKEDLGGALELYNDAWFNTIRAGN